MKHLTKLTLVAALAFSTTAYAQSTLSLSNLGVTLTNVPGNARDWVGIFPHGGANTTYTDWTYVACDNKTCATAKAAAGSTKTVHVNLPSNAAQVDIRLLSLDPSGAFHVVQEIDPDLSMH